MQQYLQNKKGLVENVFNQVYDQYDLMNDFMSLGIHRLWKKDLLNILIRYLIYHKVDIMYCFIITNLDVDVIYHLN